MAGHIAPREQYIYAYRVVLDKPEGKRPLGGPIRRWKDNINMDLRDMGYDAGHGIDHGCANHSTEGKCFCPPSAAVT